MGCVASVPHKVFNYDAVHIYAIDCPRETPVEGFDCDLFARQIVKSPRCRCQVLTNISVDTCCDIAEKILDVLDRDYDPPNQERWKVFVVHDTIGERFWCEGIVV